MRSTMMLFSALFVLFLALSGCEREEVEEFVPEEPMATEIAISIESEDQVLVNGNPMPIGQLEPYLQDLAVEEQVYAYVHAAPGVETEVIDEVQAIIARVENVEIREEMDMPEMEM